VQFENVQRRNQSVCGKVCRTVVVRVSFRELKVSWVTFTTSRVIKRMFYCKVYTYRTASLAGATESCLAKLTLTDSESVRPMLIGSPHHMSKMAHSHANAPKTSQDSTSSLHEDDDGQRHCRQRRRKSNDSSGSSSFDSNASTTRHIVSVRNVLVQVLEFLLTFVQYLVAICRKYLKYVANYLSFSNLIYFT